MFYLKLTNELKAGFSSLKKKTKKTLYHLNLLGKKNRCYLITYFEQPPVMKHMAQNAKTCIFTPCVRLSQKLKVCVVESTRGGGKP